MTAGFLASACCTGACPCAKHSVPLHHRARLLATAFTPTRSQLTAHWPACRASPKGMRVYENNKWSSLRLSTVSSSIAMLYASLPDADERTKKQAACYARCQMGYILGDTGRSYVVGIGNNYPKQVHHREVACTLAEDALGLCDRCAPPAAARGAAPATAAHSAANVAAPCGGGAGAGAGGGCPHVSGRAERAAALQRCCRDLLRHMRARVCLRACVIAKGVSPSGPRSAPPPWHGLRPMVATRPTPSGKRLRCSPLSSNMQDSAKQGELSVVRRPPQPV